MAKLKFNPRKFEALSLPQLAEELNVDYYNVLAGLCKLAQDKLNQLKGIDLHHTTEKYVDCCERTLFKVNHYIKKFKFQLLPYATELHHKEQEGHDCGNCSANCEISHQAHIVYVRELHVELRKYLDELYTFAVPLSSSFIYPGIYKSLRDEMMLIEVIIRELFYLQEVNLLPMLLESQKNINVYRQPLHIS